MSADREAPPELSHCSRCKMGTGFEWDAEIAEWVSVCCGWRALDNDRAPFGAPSEVDA